MHGTQHDYYAYWTPEWDSLYEVTAILIKETIQHYY